MSELKLTIESSAGRPVGERKPFWVKCVACAHCWIAGHFPALLNDIARDLQNQRFCPKCGADEPVVAKQSDGVLNEAKP